MLGLKKYFEILLLWNNYIKYYNCLSNNIKNNKIDTGSDNEEEGAGERELQGVNGKETVIAIVWKKEFQWSEDSHA